MKSIKIERVRKIINDLYNDCEKFDSLSPTYPDRMRTKYYKDSIIDCLRRFCNALDTYFLLIEESKLQLLNKNLNKKIKKLAGDKLK